MKQIKQFINIGLIGLLFIACDALENEGYKDFPITKTQTIDFSGDWFIRIYNPDGTLAVDYQLLATYNTSLDNEDFWINDYTFIKTIVQSNTSDLTFAGTPNSPELIADETVTVSNGQIFKDEGRSTTNRVTDSIYFEAEFSTEPGVIYVFGGHKRTGFLEDEH